MSACPTTSHRILFLPGASGDPSFWQGVGKRQPPEWEKRFLAWPGLGNQAPDPRISGFADLVDLAASELSSPSVVVAQSMGGIVAVQLTLQHPELVTHLVLTATSGGLDVAALGAADWRPDFLRSFPRTARWILEDKTDLSARLHEINVPTLLLWGDADPISPLTVGRHLATAIRGAQFEVIPGAGHAMGLNMPDVVASQVLRFVTQGSGSEAPRVTVPRRGNR
ncbi:alpha/beta hydrolase family protein [Burkholderiales bacterium GJ-E10]|nr:alpha/beta hydrolase family protein [Burkholderiales bacterium GJ-E10]